MIINCQKCDGYGCRTCGKTGKIILCNKCKVTVHNGRSWGTDGVNDYHVFCTDTEKEQWEKANV